MSLTKAQMSFLLKEKALRPNTKILVVKSNKKVVSNNYVVPQIKQIDGNLLNVYYDDKKDIYKIVYYKGVDRSKKFICSPSEIEEIDGQSVNRFYKATENLTTNANYYKVDTETDVVNTIIGKKCPTINGIPLYDGMKLILTNDKTPSMNMKVFKIKGYGDCVKLSGGVGRPKKHLMEEPKIKQKRGRKKGWRKNKEIANK